MSNSGRGREARADSKTLEKPIKRDKLVEIFQAQKARTTGPMNYYDGRMQYQVRARVVVGITCGGRCL
jgi:hypothetical protein